MEAQETTVSAVETSIQEASPQAPAQSNDPQSAQQVEAAAVAGGSKTEAAQQAAPVYTPSYKFKVANQEKEMDEFIRSVIKDADTEKKVRELYEKAYGLDIVKPRMNEFRDKAKSLETEYTALKTDVDQVLNLKEKDLGAFFQALQLPKEKVFQWVSDQLNYENLPQDERNRVDRERMTAQKADLLEKKYQEIEQFAQAQATHARTIELKYSLNTPDVKTFADRFDASAGTPGAFESEVIKMGRTVFLESGQDISAEQAVKLVMDHYGRFLGTAPAAPQQAAQQIQNPQAPQATAGKSKPVIPAVSAKSTSPAERTVGSLDDLKKLYNEKYGSMQI